MASTRPQPHFAPMCRAGAAEPPEAEVFETRTVSSGNADEQLTLAFRKKINIIMVDES